MLVLPYKKSNPEKMNYSSRVFMRVLLEESRGTARRVDRTQDRENRRSTVGRPGTWAQTWLPRSHAWVGAQSGELFEEVKPDLGVTIAATGT